MSKVVKPESKNVGVSLIIRLTLDPWILMLALGALSHRLQRPELALSFWVSLLLVIAVQSISPGGITKWVIEDE